MTTETSLDGEIRKGKARTRSAYETVSFMERCRRIRAGLRQPRDSGEHKHAIQELQHLYSLAAAFVAPLAVVLLLVFVSSAMKPAWEEPILINLNPPPEQLELDPIQPPPPDPMPTVINTFPVSDPNPGLPDGLASATDPLPTTRGPESPEPNRPEFVAATKCRITLQGVYRQRIGATRLGKPGGATLRSEEAVLRALRWLKQCQESDGSWLTSSGGGEREHGGAAPGMTGLALLTFLGHGELPASEEFGETVQKGISWLTGNQQPNGRYASSDPHDYSHPIAAYALAEAFGMTRHPDVKPFAERAARVILDGQHPNGLWDYNCRASARDDLSYSGWCIQALKAAHIANVEPDRTEAALRRAAAALRSRGTQGGQFQYVAEAAPTETMTAVGVLCRQLCDPGCVRSPQELLRGLTGATMAWRTPWTPNPLYAWYYVSQAKFHAGGPQWERWNKDMQDEFTASQVVVGKAAGTKGGKFDDVGYWRPAANSEHAKSLVYNTTLCTLVLEIPYRTLPTYKPPADSDLEAAIGGRPDDIKITPKNSEKEA